MIDRMIFIYCICDDFLKKFAVEPWPNTKMTDAEVMTTFIVTHTDFYGNLERAGAFLQEHGYIPNMLEKSRFCRRLHRLGLHLWQRLIQFVLSKGSLFGLPDEFIVDSFPVRVCQGIRMHRAKLFPGDEFKGFNACRKEYFRGLKIHVLVTTIGRPWAAWITPGSVHDFRAYKEEGP